MPTIAQPRSRASRISDTTTDAVGGIEGGRGLVEQQDGIVAHEAARDVDPLLLAAGERGRRYRPQPLGQIQPREEGPGEPGRAPSRRLDPIAQELARNDLLGPECGG